MDFDLSSLDALQKNLDEGIALEIKHPVSGQPIGLTIKLLGYESETVKALQRKAANERIRNPRHVVTAEEIESRTIRMQAATIKGWAFAEGFTLDGKVPECNPTEAERLLRRFPFIAKQVDDAAADQARFLEA